MRKLAILFFAAAALAAAKPVVDWSAVAPDVPQRLEPFIGHEPMPPGRSLFPKGITRDEIEAYVKAHPKEKNAIYDERTVVELVSRTPLKLRTVPYHVKYNKWLVSAAKHLRNAAASS